MQKSSISRIFLSAFLLFSSVAMANEDTINNSGLEQVVFDSRPLSAEKRDAMEKLRAEELETTVDEKGNQKKWANPSILHQSTMASYCPLSSHRIEYFPAYNMIKLEDGSEWTVDPSDEYKMRTWRTGDAIGLAPKTGWWSAYTYVLTNKSLGSSVNVLPFLGPVQCGFYTYWVVGLDSHLGHIYLINGRNERSTWVVSPRDMDLFKDWGINDTVIIGDNDNWFWWFTNFDHVLINVNMNHYIHAKHL